MKKLQNQLQNNLRIVGISIRTQGERAPAEIGALWQKAGQEGLVPTDGSPAYGVYFNYESDNLGPYDVLVGRQSEEPLKPGQQEVHIPAGNYFVVADRGEVPKIVQGAWQFVHSDWEQSNARTYAVDYERYIGGPAHADFELWVGLS